MFDGGQFPSCKELQLVQHPSGQFFSTSGHFRVSTSHAQHGEDLFMVLLMLKMHLSVWYLESSTNKGVHWPPGSSSSFIVSGSLNQHEAHP